MSARFAGVSGLVSVLPLGEYVLHGAHLFEGAAVRTAGDGDLGTAQGCARLHRSDGLQWLERRAQEERLAGVAEAQGDFSLGREDDEASAVGGFD